MTQSQLFKKQFLHFNTDEQKIAGACLDEVLHSGCAETNDWHSVGCTRFLLLHGWTIPGFARLKISCTEGRRAMFVHVLWNDSWEQLTLLVCPVGSHAKPLGFTFFSVLVLLIFRSFFVCLLFYLNSFLFQIFSILSAAWLKFSASVFVLIWWTSEWGWKVWIVSSFLENEGFRISLSPFKTLLFFCSVTVLKLLMTMS